MVGGAVKFLLTMLWHAITFYITCYMVPTHRGEHVTVYTCLQCGHKMEAHE